MCTVTTWAAGPEVHGFLPAGGQRGTSVEVSIGGKLPTWPAQFWVDGAGLTVTPKEEKGKLTIAIAPDAVPGTRWLHVHDAAGASAPVPFIVGPLAEVLETEPNDQPAKVTSPLTLPIVANGRLARSNDVDCWGVQLRQGQTLVASLVAHEGLGSPVDAVLQVVAPNGQTVAYNHDQRGLDPEIVFTAPADGTYFVRLFGFPSTPNQTIGFAGGESFTYRLTLTTGAFIDYCWPLAVKQGRPANVELFGWNIPDGERTLSIDPQQRLFTIADPRFANVVNLRAESHETIVEIEPNAPAAPQAITPDVTITGRIEAPGDIDAFAFAGKPAEPLLFELASRELGYPLDAVLQVFDAAGKSLARADDVGEVRDPVLAFTPPAEGTYRVQVTDLNNTGSARHVYALRATRPQPAYQVQAAANAFTVSPDKPTEIALTVDRQHGFAEEIAFRVEGLPEFITAAPAVSAATGDSAKTVKLILTSRGGNFSGPIRIIGESTGPLKRSVTATAAIANHTARCEQLWLNAVEAAKKP